MVPGLVRDLRLELLLQLLLAVVLGGAIGLERELSGKPAGLRTNILICTGATFFTVLSLTIAATLWVVAAIGMGLGSGAYIEAIGATALVLVVLGGLRPVERLVALKSSRSHLIIHARPEATTVEDLESLVRASGLEVDRTSFHRENVDLVVELELRGPRRLHDQALIACVHHPS